MILSLFDFDGTVTTDDSLIRFIRFVVGDIKAAWGMFLFLTPKRVSALCQKRTFEYFLSEKIFCAEKIKGLYGEMVPLTRGWGKFDTRCTPLILYLVIL